MTAEETTIALKVERQSFTAEVAENWRFVEDIEMWAKKRIRETQDEVCL